MAKLDLAAIRQRDVDADRCQKCGYEGGRLEDRVHDETAAECEARLRATEGRGCWEPESHHPYEPGGLSSWGDDQDRRDLLGEVDRLRAALVLADAVVDAGAEWRYWAGHAYLTVLVNRSLDERAARA